MSEDTPVGDNVVNMPQKPTPEAVQEMQKKITDAMNDERLQQFASAIILGNQLYAWGAMFLSNEPGHDPVVLHTMIDAVQSSMIDESGTPRPFAEDGMLANIKELVPFMDAEIAKHAEQREAINKLTDDMIRDAAEQALKKKEQETSE